ncbi:MAG: twin-arginine translocase TatA/TatE family subunit [Lentisphaeria bacterium]|nr:twin-arginine translocase TatA/TatE family subunit [Lentisphaeria bacterium]
MSLGWPEIVLILLVVLLLFGANRIPEIARSLGKATKEFKRARDEFADELKNADSEQDKQIADKSEAQDDKKV